MLAVLPCVLWVGLCVWLLYQHTRSWDEQSLAFHAAGAPMVAIEPGLAGYKGFEPTTIEHWLGEYPVPEHVSVDEWHQLGKQVVHYRNSMAAYAKAYNAQYEMLQSLKRLWWTMLLIPLPVIFFAFWKQTA